MGQLDGNPLDFLGALTEDERAAFHAAGRVRCYAKGEAILHEGDDPGGVIAILHGRAKVSAAGVAGRDVVLRFAGEGELLGEISAIAGRPRTATITALDALETVAMRTAEFQRFIEQHPRVAPLVLERIALLLADADRQLVDFATRDVTARIAGRLLELADTDGEPSDAGIRITLPLSQDELGAWAGASREAVARSLHLLRELGWIETRRREIRVLNADGLRSLV
jgi:CRP/FNR family transcriptional regulator, cyclic AMP receptor protein